jgi:hypothetical protein
MSALIDFNEMKPGERPPASPPNDGRLPLTADRGATPMHQNRPSHRPGWSILHGRRLKWSERMARLRGRFEIRCERAIWSRERGQSITFASSHFSRGAAVEIRHQMRAEIAGVIASTIDQSGFSTAHELSPHQIHPW